MAASNESQGLKIAVAVFVTLSVLLAVTTYFGYAEYNKAEALRAKAAADKSTADKASSDALSTAEALRKEVGVRSEDPEAVKTEIKNEHAKIEAELKSLVDQVTAAVTKAQAAGAQGAELEESKARVQQLAAAYQSEPNKTYISSLARMTDLLKNLSLLSTQLSLNYTDVKRGLEGSNEVAAQKIAVAEKQYNDAKTDLTGEQEKHVTERQDLLNKVDSLQTERARLETELANLTTKLRQTEEDDARKLALSQQTVRELRDRVERKESILDRPDGYVTHVDYSQGLVHTNVSRANGARPQMVFAIFDAKSAGVPTDKPKGTIELIDVNDRGGVARIVKTNSTIDPIRVGDIVYSAAWSPNDPMRFALIGKIDINRDGVDDREDLKRMIQAAGGIVDYDLPPPEAGKEYGKLTGRDAWYVVDERPALAETFKPTNVTAAENTEFLKKQTEAVREARLNGVRPMPIERLLPYLGYDFAAPVRGRAEAVNNSALKRVTGPKQGTEQPAAPPAEGEAPADAPR